MSEWGKITTELKLEDVLGYFKDVLGSSFRPLCDLVVSQLYKHWIDLLDRQHKEERDERIKKLVEEKGVTFEEAVHMEEERAAAHKAKEDHQPDTSLGSEKTDEERRERFMFHAVSLQLHMENKQTVWVYFENMDPLNKGYISLRDFILLLQGPYRVIGLPDDIRKIAMAYE